MNKGNINVKMLGKLCCVFCDSRFVQDNPFFAMGNSFMRLCSVGNLIYLLWSLQIEVKPGPGALSSKKTEMCVLSSAHGLLV